MLFFVLKVYNILLYQLSDYDLCTENYTVLLPQHVQSVVLFILYTLIICGVILRWNPRYHAKTGFTWIVSSSLQGQLPWGWPDCHNPIRNVYYSLQQQLTVSFSNALQFVMGRGFPPHACWDLIYSRHVGCTLICMTVLHRHMDFWLFTAAVVWIIAIIGIYFTISCRSHYSVDVVLAFYFGYFIPEWYFNRSDGRVRGRMSKWIMDQTVRSQTFRFDMCWSWWWRYREDIMSENKYLLTISV